MADHLLGVAAADHVDHLAGGDAFAGQSVGQDLDLDLLLLPANHEALPGVRDLLELLQQVQAETAQAAAVQFR